MYKSFCIFSTKVTAVEGDVEEDTIHCATCGVQVSLKKAMVHMEKCFMKVSSSYFPDLPIIEFIVLPVGGKCVIWRCSEE